MMDFFFTGVPAVANGNISPCRFLTTVSGNANFLLVVQATADTQFHIGVSERWTRFPPNSPGDDGFIAISGEQVSYRGPLQIATLKLGGTVSNQGVLLTTDGSGQGIAATIPTGGSVGYARAIAMRSGVSGDFIPVYVLPPTINPIS